MVVWLLCVPGLEMRVKESNRQLTASELGRDQLNSDLESLRLQLMESQQWQAEKKVNFLSHSLHFHSCMPLLSRLLHIV